MLTANELRLLEEMATGSVERLEPSVEMGEGGVRYPQAEAYLGDAAGVADAVRSLAERGLLVAEDERTFRVCPDCESERMDLRMLCVDCGSDRTFRRDVIEHLACGCTRPRAEFETGRGEYVCPECDGTLRALGVDYTKMGVQHACDACGERFDEPDHRFVCDGCESVVSPADAPEVDASAYRFNEERRKWLEGELYLKRDLERRLRDRGFAVTTDATLRGRSGREYRVHLRATDELLGLDFAVSVVEGLTDHDVARVRMLSEDAGVHPILLTLEDPRRDEALSAVAEQFGITVVGRDEYVEAADGRTAPVTEAENPTSAD